MQLFDVSVQPTEEEWREGLGRSGLRRAGNGRLIVQTVLLAAVAAVSAVSFVTDGRGEPMSLVIALAAAILIPVMWIVPAARMASLAKTAAEEGQTVHLWVFDEGFDFGEQVTGPYYAFQAVHWAMPTDGTLETIVLRTKSDEVVVLPRRCFTDDQWQTLTAKIAV